MNAPLLVMDDVSAAYGDFQALFNITLYVNSGEVVTLIGSNGSGKTTTLRVISGLLKPKRGSVTFNGADLAKTPAHEIVALGISHVPEGRQLFPHMSEKLASFGYMGDSESDDLVRRSLRKICAIECH